jgi:predicted ATP-dependent serine protease
MSQLAHDVTVRRLSLLPKAPTGIGGLDEVTGGGLPRGRPTLICGPAGSGKTLLAMEFLIRGITDYGEPGVFIAFEETAADLAANSRRSRCGPSSTSRRSVRRSWPGTTASRSWIWWRTRSGPGATTSWPYRPSSD